jgi:hypothetical protein
MNTRTMRRAAFGSLAATAAAASLFTAAPAQATASAVRPDSYGVSGSVVCLSENAVEGIWVSASSGTSGWATLSAASGTESAVSWTYTLSSNTSYYIHVGCGGSPQNWAVNTYSATGTGGKPGLICYDVVYEDPYYGKCR